MALYKQINLRNIKTVSIRNRKSKVNAKAFAKVFDSSRGSFATFIDSLPHILVAEEMRDFVADVVKAVRRRRPVIAMIGAHVIKVGLSPLLVDMVKRKIFTCISMNSASAIHDVETAMWGKTSEDVERTIGDGTFGMSKETGDFINGTLTRAFRTNDVGYGEALGRALRKAPHKNLSILATCYEQKIPVTVHAAIGTDIIHQQPTMDGAATGELSFRDFKVLCQVVKDLRGAGVVMNIGSAVVLPEVFLKSVTVARNLGHPVRGFTTANFDMIQRYRPYMNVVTRPTQKGGRGFLFTGHHEVMIPLVFAMIKIELGKR